jgi:hypothetical protein
LCKAQATLVLQVVDKGWWCARKWADNHGDDDIRERLEAEADGKAFGASYFIPKATRTWDIRLTDHRISVGVCHLESAR